MGTKVKRLSIPDSVVELCDGCFKYCQRLRCVTFGAFSNLERIGAEAFCASAITELFIPDTVRCFGEKCFAECDLSRIIFGASSKLELISKGAFSLTRVQQLSIPDSVRELGDQCFCKSGNMRTIKFGDSSRLERIGNLCFAKLRIESFVVPDSVTIFGGGVFSECPAIAGVTCSETCGLVVHDSLLFNKDFCVCYGAVGVVSEIVIPSSVREICDQCFCECVSLLRVTFGASSQVTRIGSGSFMHTSIEEVIIPDSVVELCDRCFSFCSRLRKVIFGQSSKLERIGDQAFQKTAIQDISIPDSVRELGARCFHFCWRLSRVRFSTQSRLERLGDMAFESTLVGRQHLPLQFRGRMMVVSSDTGSIIKYRSGCTW